MSEERFRVLHALKLRGLADQAAVHDITGYDDATIEGVLRELAEAGAVREREGRRPGFTMTGEGRDEHTALLAERASDAERDVAQRGYDRFLAVNRDFKQVCTDWQLDRSEDTLFGLDDVHERIAPTLGALRDGIPRFARYPERLDALLTRIHDGDTDAFLKPLTGSYHDVWMELHEDLLLATGAERGEKDE